jgi:hypothetical protein
MSKRVGRLRRRPALAFQAYLIAAKSLRTKARRSLRGERWPLSRALGKAQFYAARDQRTRADR